MEFYEILQEIMQEKGLTIPDVARNCGLTDSTVRSIIDRKQKKVALSVAFKISEGLNVSLQRLNGSEDTVKLQYGSMTPTKNISIPLASNIEPLPKTKKIPIVGEIACGTPILAQENITDYADMPKNINADFALICKGDSMVGAGIQDGDIVYIKKQDIVQNGQIAAVIANDNCEATLKRFYRDGNKVTLTPENPAYPPMVYVNEEINSLRVIGKAVGYLHRF